jgi:hypothetical protein
MLQALKARWNTRKMMDREGLDAAAANLMLRAKCKLTINKDREDQPNCGLLPSYSSSGSSYYEGYRNHFASNASHRIA